MLRRAFPVRTPIRRATTRRGRWFPNRRPASRRPGAAVVWRATRWPPRRRTSGSADRWSIADRRWSTVSAGASCGCIGRRSRTAAVRPFDIVPGRTGAPLTSFLLDGSIFVAAIPLLVTLRPFQRVLNAGLLLLQKKKSITISSINTRNHTSRTTLGSPQSSQSMAVIKRTKREMRKHRETSTINDRCQWKRTI